MRDYTKFFTPPHVAKFMAGLLDPQPMQVVLEPSAGNGALVRAVKEACFACIVFAFEINPDHKKALKEAGADVNVTGDYLLMPDYAKFTCCIANPPFGNETDLGAHFEKICLNVRKGGKIVMIVPESFYPMNVDCIVHPLENWSKNSDGTTTAIKIIEFINP